MANTWFEGAFSGGISENLSGCLGFGWQDGYGAFTESKSQVPEVEDYIRGRREHHRIRTFKEEYRALLERHEIDCQERSLWDSETTGLIFSSDRLARPEGLHCRAPDKPRPGGQGSQCLTK